MRNRFETLAAAAAMAVGGCEDEARQLCRELEALKARGRQTIVIALGPDTTAHQAACIEQLLTRFSSDVLLMAMGDVRRSVLHQLRRTISEQHFLTFLHLPQKDTTRISMVVRALQHIQFAICAGAKATWCSKNSHFPVFTV